MIIYTYRQDIEISTAYEVLSDDTKRKNYDQFGNAEGKPNRPQEGKLLRFRSTKQYRKVLPQCLELEEWSSILVVQAHLEIRLVLVIVVALIHSFIR
jgi:curved DNA-binding protein CbpA